MGKVYHEIRLENTEVAFKARSDRELKRAFILFKMFSYPGLTRWAMKITTLMLRMGLPVQWLVKPLVFKHFCGGVSLDDCQATQRLLASSGVKTIPDYSAEGKADRASFERVREEVMKAIAISAHNSEVLFAVFKPTGIAPFRLWEKLSEGTPLDAFEQVEAEELESRLDQIFSAASARGISVLVDAEETWIQPAVDHYTRVFSEKYNGVYPVVFNTVQMYRHDRLSFIMAELLRASTKGYYLGYKLVRGAYLEKEQERARAMGYPSPVFSLKEETDEAYNAALAYCFEHRDRIAMCAATHNETSTLMLAEMVRDAEGDLPLPVTFAQLYGMSDHLTFNMTQAGYTTAKYLPYGPVEEVIPYLFRRAEENKSVEGQTSRELHHLKVELKRRRKRGPYGV